MTCQSTQELILQDIFAFHGHQMMAENGHAAIFERKKTETTTTESRERSAEQLVDIVDPVALAVEGTDLGTSEDPFEPTARCTNDTKKRQLVTRSDLPRLRCCVCHLHHKRAVNAPAAVRECFETMLQQVCHFKVDVIAGNANAATCKYYKNQEYQYLHDSLCCRHAERDATRGQYGTPI